MTTNKQILKDVGEDLIKEIDARLSSKNINNTNQASDSLKEVSTNNNLKIKGVGYIRFIDVGRKPGKFAPVDVIQEWVRTKLGIQDEKEVKQVAFLVNRKLAVKGNRMFLDKSKGLQLDEIIEMGIEKINEAITDNIVLTVKSEIKTIMQGI